MDRGISLELDPQVVMSAEDRRRDRIRSATVATYQCRVARISITDLYKKKKIFLNILILLMKEMNTSIKSKMQLTDPSMSNPRKFI